MHRYLNWIRTIKYAILAVHKCFVKNIYIYYVFIKLCSFNKHSSIWVTYEDSNWNKCFGFENMMPSSSYFLNVVNIFIAPRSKLYIYIINIRITATKVNTHVQTMVAPPRLHKLIIDLGSSYPLFCTCAEPFRVT